jgi:hydroxymethylpyrimidine pyrophosphatase-like HAD family hydrolase/fructoselysine-6-P-deglycase FrlB-like protein
LGKPYTTELEELNETYARSLALPVHPLAVLVRAAVRLPLISIGSGGSLTSAHFAAFLHTLHTGKLAKAITPLELVSSPVTLQENAVLALTAGGRNPDILGCFEDLLRRDPALLGIVCARKETPIAQMAVASRIPLFDFELPAGKDGFLATNSLLATCVLLARAYRQAWLEEEALPPKLEELLHPGVTSADFFDDLKLRSTNLWQRETVLILHGYATQPAAIDLESKFTEAAIGHAQISDYRNFAHGRHHWLARYGNATGVVALTTPSDRNMADKTLRLLPEEVAVLRVDLGDDGIKGALTSITLALHLAGLAAEARGIDPGRPSVPTFGRKIYHLHAMSSPPLPPDMTEAEKAAIERKARASIITLSAQGQLQSWREAYATFLRALRGTHFGAIIFDYDGTLCGPSERFTGPQSAVSQQLTTLLKAGVLVGIATGRGKSVRTDLRQAVTDPTLWKHVLVGYHNGSEIAFLDDDTQPPARGELHESLRAIEAAIRAHPQLVRIGKSEAKNRQITLEGVPAEAAEEAWETMEQLLREIASPGVTALRSSHSIDVLAPKVSKRALIECIRSSVGAATPILCIGDRGRWPGNDFSLLSEPLSLSVDEVSSDKGTCWNLASPGRKCVDATLEYLHAMHAKSGALKVKL